MYDDWEDKISELFEKHDDDEYLNFARVENKTSIRSDLHAFNMLDKLFPSTSNMISDAEHDQIWINIDYDQIETLTEDQIIELIRSGVRYDDESLYMLV